MIKTMSIADAKIMNMQDMRLERFLVRLKEYQESVRQAIKEGPLCVSDHPNAFHAYPVSMVSLAH